MPVAAALANWNGAAYLGRCLAALEAQSRAVDEIVVVDNGSTDGSDDWIERHHPRVQLLRNPRNEGYCAGYNRAIAATTADAVLVLNTDVYLETGFVAACLAVLSEEVDTAAVTGEFYEEATQRTISGGFYLRRSMRMRPAPTAQTPTEVFGASGAAVLFRRAALEEAGGPEKEVYDRRFFSYGEDIDLAWRLRRLGWRVRTTPAARAHHVGSGSLGGALRFVDKPARFQRHAWKNRYLTMLNNAPLALWPELILALLLTDLLLWPYLCLRQPRRIPYLLGGIVDVLRLAPSSWTRRRDLHQRALRQRGPHDRDAPARVRLGAAAVRPWLRGW